MISINIIKKMYKKILYGYKSDSNSYIKFLKKNGVSIGKNVTFYEPNTNYIDYQKGFLISIGDNVEITRGVVMITHDYSWSLFKKNHGEILGSREKIKIGDNVFLGINSVIMKGVTIESNVIVGANSVVTKSIPSNSVVCGNPAKVICSVDDFYNKRKKLYVKEAVDMFLEYYKKYDQIPDKTVFDEFFFIFEERNSEINKKFVEKMKLTGNYESSLTTFKNSKPEFNGYHEFCNYCLKQLKGESNEKNCKEN